MEIDLSTPEKITTAAAACGALLLLLRKVRSFLYNIYRYCRNIVLVPNSLHKHFGNDSGEKILATLKEFSLHASLDRIEIEILHHNLGIGIFLCSPDGKCIRANHFLAELFGIDKENMLGYGWLSSVKEDERQEVHEAWAYAVANDIPYKVTYQIKNPRTNKCETVVARAWAKKEGGVTVAYCGFVKIKSET